MAIHSLADLYSLIADQKWAGKIIESSNRDNLISSDSSRELKNVVDGFIEHGVCFGDRVIVQADLSCKTVMALVGLWKIGAIVIPVKSEIDPKKIAPLAIDANARFVIKPVSNEIIEIASYRAKPEKFKFNRSRKVCGTDLALIIYSSGSTGTPKGIMLSHANVVVALASIVDYLDISSKDTILCISPLSFDYGLYQVLFSFYTDCDVVLYNQPANPLVIISAISAFSVTILPLVPSLASSIERVLHLAKTALTSLQKITNTGGHLLETVIQGLSKKLPHVKIYAMYGLTESKRVAYLPPQDLTRKLGSVGIPMPGLEAKVFRIVDEPGRRSYVEALPNEQGILFVRGPSVMQGYTCPSQEGSYLVAGEYRDDNWLCTNDLFSCDEDGYLYFKGREKDLIKQGGFCLYPKDIEVLISQNSSVLLIAIVDDHDVVGDEIAHCFIQIDNLKDSAQAEVQIRKWIEENVDIDYRPRKISFLPKLPLSDNDKIDRKALKASLTANLRAS